MEEKIITVHGKNFKVVKSDKSDNQGVCLGCSAKEYTYDCDSYRKHNNGRCDGVIFKEVLVRPPIGIMPLRTHNALRLNALMETLQRYAESGSQVKVQWVQEVKSQIEYERSLTRKALDKVPFKI